MHKRYPLPDINRKTIEDSPCFCLFETTMPDTNNFTSYILTHPVKTVCITDPADIPDAFELIETYAADHYIGGYFAYELGYCLDDVFHHNHTSGYPLINLGIFQNATEFDHKTGKISRESGIFSDQHVNTRQYSVGHIGYIISQEEYREALTKIHHYISEGDIYQANFTFKGTFSFTGDAYSFYRDLAVNQPVAYSSFMKMDDEFILSLSPELFFRKNGTTIESRPMKGTIRRGINITEDEFLKQNLQNSEKDRAENTMIVDLIRNDIGKISEFGSVSVPKLHTIEKYRTLFQMTSTVRGNLNKDIDFNTLFSGLFPCGSVTGAPKIRAMQIIRELEKEDRGVYCGAIGLIRPDKDCVFNVPIRTITIRDNRGEIGLGSGIVADSDIQSEYEECKLKSHFLTKRRPHFHILETLLWDNGYTFLVEHLKRMKASADYFDYPINTEGLRAELADYSAIFEPGLQYRVRLLLDEFGRITIEHSEIEEKQCGSEKITLSEYRTDPDDIFLYHKTTNRGLYDSEYKKYAAQGYYDVLFFNERDELTEGAISNVFLKVDDSFYTPALSCGLLNGIYRQKFIRENSVEETVIGKEMLMSADEIYVCNSVRGMQEVTIE